MQNLRSGVVIGLIALLFAVAAAGAAKEEAICLVCKVKEGATHAEAVVAERTHEGVRYGFCAETCAAEFDTDPAAYLPPRFPRPAPKLAVADLAGTTIDWQSLAGKVVLVDFWATWCAPCKKSMPELQALQDRYAARGFTVIGVSIDEKKDLDKVRKYVASKKLTYPIALDSDDDPAWDRYRVKAIPAAFLVDKEARIVAQWTGIAPGAAAIEAELQRLLGD